jgi:PAS domain S-box-containing protein
MISNGAVAFPRGSLLSGNFQKLSNIAMVFGWNQIHKDSFMRKYQRFLFCICIGLLLCSLPGSVLGADLKIAQNGPEVALTDGEREWLKQHPVIRVSNEPDYAPFDFMENGEPAGFSIDYLNLVVRRAGLRLEYVQDTWKNLVEMGKQKQIDLLHTVFYTPEREAFFHFTEPYKTVVNGIFIRDGVAGVNSLQDLAGKQVVLPKGDTIAEQLPQLVPGGEYTFVDTYEAILKSISLGKGDATVMDTAVANYLIRKNTLTNIRPVAEAQIDSRDRDPRYRIAIRKDWPELHSILQKAMHTVTRDEMAVLESRWFGITPPFGNNPMTLTLPKDSDAMPLTLALFIPRQKPFWLTIARYAKAVATSLEIGLEVVDFHDDADFLLKEVERVCREGANGLIFSAFESTGEAVLQIAEKHSTPAFMINTDIAGADFTPRTKYKHWLGKMTPDDTRTGTTLIQQLLTMAGEAGISKYHVLAIEGAPHQEASILRRKGLEAYVKYASDIASITIRSGNWQREAAAALFKEHYAENPDINVVWCANDIMAIGVADAVQALGIEKPLFIGGMNWDPPALEAIGEGRLHASTGGHFMEGGWAVLLLHDYLRGTDFATESISFTTTMPTITRSNLSTFLYFLALNPDAVDFRPYSKAYNPARLEYNMDLGKVANDLYLTKPSTAGYVSLTSEEKAWIAAHPVIQVHNEKDWPPFNYFEYGTPRGLSIDYMNLVAAKLGIEVKYITGPSWKELLEMVQRKELDVMLNIVKTEDRQKYILYTEPYVKNPNVIVSSEKNAYESIEALFGKVVAYPKGFFYEEVLTKSFPRIKRLPAENTLASLKAVAFGRADAALGEAAVIRTLINRNMLASLQISGEVELGNPDLTNLRIGVRDDWPLLRSALMKAMAAITPQEMNQIRQEWLVTDKRQVNEKDGQRFGAGQQTIPLSSEEWAWLAEHPTIRFTGDPDWLPQEAFTSEGQYVGIVADILDLIEARLGIRFERVPVETWDNAVQLAETARVDMLSETTNSGRDTLIFTKPHLVFPVVVIAEQGTPPISDPGDLKGKRVAVVKDYGYVAPFRRQFPNLDYVVVETVREGLMRLSTGEVDVFLSATSTASYLMSELGLTNLSVIGTTGLSLDLGFGVRKDMPVLVGILNKALASITEEEKFTIRQKWIPVINTPAPQTAVPVSYQRLIIYGVAVFLTLSLLALILIRSIRRETIAVSFGSSWFRGLVLAGLSGFVLMVAFLGWTMLERNKTAQLLDVDENLRGILSISEDRLNLWLEERLSYMARLGRDPELVAITKRLLPVGANKRALLASGALQEARFFFQNAEDIFSKIGFFLINPEHVSIGSMRDANLGTLNLIAEQHPELLQQAFQGQVGFVPPMTSDVALGNVSASDSGRKPPTMSFIGPVQDTDGRILAVMTLRVNPWKDFSRALKSYGRRASRESYAFDRNGVMLSASQFDDQLRHIGLLVEGQSSALNIEIRDPGGNMVAGYRPNVERSQQPLTQMVSSALTLRQQLERTGIQQGPSSIESNIEGYRDYRGVPVFGAWLWNADLDMGFAAEIDVDEALFHYYRTRTMIFSILGFTLFLSVGAILFVLIIGERTSRALMRARDDLEKKVTERTTELQENQKELESAVERSRLLLDSAGEGIFGVDPEGNVAFINPAASRMLGYDPEELIGRDVHAEVHHSHADGSHYPKDDCPMYLTHREGTAHNVTDEVLWHKDGTQVPVEYTSMPVRKDGQVVGAVVTFRDITERRAMEVQLEATKSQLQNILDTSPIGVAFSTQGKIHFANPRFKEMFGVGVGEASPDLYVHPEDRDALVRELKEKGKVENRDLQMYNGDHQIRDMLITYLPITYDGAEGILGWLLDITDRKIVEKEIKEKYEELNRFRKIAIGRELKMIELKKEINELFLATGKSERYKIH